MSDHHWSYTSAHHTAENGRVLVQKRCTLCDLGVEYWTGIEPVHPACTYNVDTEKLALVAICVLRDRLRKGFENTADAEQNRKVATSVLGFDPCIVPLAGADLATLVGDSVLEEAKAMLRLTENSS